MAALGDLGLVRQRAVLRLDVLVRLFEDLFVAFVLLDHPIHGLVELEQQLRIAVLFAEPGGAGLGDRIEQLARRVLAAHEERAVLQRGAHQRHLQALQQAGGRRIAAHFAFDFRVQQAEQIEGVGILRRQRRLRAMFGAQRGQQRRLHVAHLAAPAQSGQRTVRWRLRLQFAQGL